MSLIVRFANFLTLNLIDLIVGFIVDPTIRPITLPHDRILLELIEQLHTSLSHNNSYLILVLVGFYNIVKFKICNLKKRLSAPMNDYIYIYNFFFVKPFFRCH